MGKGYMNTGVMFVKHTNFTKKLYDDIYRSFRHRPNYTGPATACGSNEQACLNGWAWSQTAYPGLRDHVLKVTSAKYHLNPCVWYWCNHTYPNIDPKHACHACSRVRGRCQELCSLYI